MEDCCVGESEPILSMSKLVRMIFHVAWRRQAGLVVHPALGRVPVIVEDGCPRVDTAVAFDLIRRIDFGKKTCVDLRIQKVRGLPLSRSV